MGVFPDFPTQAVFVIAVQRSGTNLLRKSLAQTPLFTDLNEVFDPFHSKFWTYRERAIKSKPDFLMPTETSQLELWTGFLKSSMASINTPFTLIDVKYNSTHNLNGVWQEPGAPPLLVRWIQRQRVPVIHVVRENLLDCYVSNLLACKLGVWDAENDRISRDISFRLDPQNTVREIARRHREIELFRQWLGDSRHVELPYERLAKTENGQLQLGLVRQICELLKIQPSDVPARVSVATRKMGRSARHLITNFTEIADALDRNGFGFLTSEKKAA